MANKVRSMSLRYWWLLHLDDKAFGEELEVNHLHVADEPDEKTKMLKVYGSVETLLNKDHPFRNVVTIDISRIKRVELMVQINNANERELVEEHTFTKPGRAARKKLLVGWFIKHRGSGSPAYRKQKK